MPVDSDSENEEKNNEEKFEDRFKIGTTFFSILASDSKLEIFHLLGFQSNYPPETPTPPPELFKAF